MKYRKGKRKIITSIFLESFKKCTSDFMAAADFRYTRGPKRLLVMDKVGLGNGWCIRWGWTAKAFRT